MTACPRCGVENPLESQFCMGCGTKLAVVGPTAAGAASNAESPGDQPVRSGPTTVEKAARPATPVQTPGSGRSKTRLIVGCLGLAGCTTAVAICLVLAVLYYVGANSGVPEEDSAKRDVATSTATPISPALAVPTATPRPKFQLGNEVLTIKEILIVEDFSNPNPAWKEAKVEGLYNYISDGEYHIEIRNKNISKDSSVRVPKGFTNGDFALLVNARTDPTTTKSNYGLSFGDEAAKQHYQLTISDNGYFRINYFGPRAEGAPAWQTLVQWQATKAISPPGTFNQLAIVRQGTTLTFYLNEQQLTKVENSAMVAPSTVGVYAATADEPLANSYDKFFLVLLE